MNLFTRKLAVVALSFVTVICTVGMAAPASADSAAYDAGIWSVTSPRTGRSLGQVGYREPYCNDSGYGFLGVGKRCYFGYVDVIKNVSDDVTVYRYTEAQYRTRTGTNTYTPWTKVQNTGTWSHVRCDSSPYSECGNDTGISVCGRDSGYVLCTSQGGIGLNTQWKYADGTYACGAQADAWLATLDCSVPVDIGPGEQLWTRTTVYFYERSTNQWSYGSLARIIS